MAFLTPPKGSASAFGGANCQSAVLHTPPPSFRRIWWHATQSFSDASPRGKGTGQRGAVPAKGVGTTGSHVTSPTPGSTARARSCPYSVANLGHSALPCPDSPQFSQACSNLQSSPNLHFPTWKAWHVPLNLPSASRFFKAAVPPCPHLPPPLDAKRSRNCCLPPLPFPFAAAEGRGRQKCNELRNTITSCRAWSRVNYFLANNAFSSRQSSMSAASASANEGARKPLSGPPPLCRSPKTCLPASWRRTDDTSPSKPKQCCESSAAVEHRTGTQMGHTPTYPTGPKLQKASSGKISPSFARPA